VSSAAGVAETAPLRAGAEAMRQAELRARRSMPDQPVSALPAVPIGTLLEKKYALVEEIGRGSMGTVFLADDVILQRRVAVKFLLPELVALPDNAERFHREAIAMAAITDQNVAQIYTYGERDGLPYFVMEHLPGQTVESLITDYSRRGMFVPLRTALDIIWQVVAGIGEIHRSGAVHRDIKPANIMLTDEPQRAVIVDFGLVRDVRVVNDTLALAGTPAYIAPELVESTPGADRSRLVDIYSAGVTAYELITGSIPFGGESWIEILNKHVCEEPVAPSARRPGLPPLLDETVLTAMAKDPAYRYQDAEAFLKSLMLVDSSELAEVVEPDRAAVEPNVLVFDRDPAFLGLLSGTAGDAVPGCSVNTASNTESALQLLEQWHPQVVFLDLALPDLAGLEVAATIRTEQMYQDVEIVAVASHDSVPDDDTLEWLSLNRFLEKPVDADRLADLLCTLCKIPPGAGPTPVV
jgi:serine/threonine-protein kinase